MIRLWSINRWLRWVGISFIVQTADGTGDIADRGPTMIGFMWVGWPPERKWAEYCARTNALPAAKWRDEVAS